MTNTNISRQAPDEQGILTRDDDDAYTIMPNVIIDDATLTTVEKMVLLAVYRRCRATDAGHPVFPSYADIARLARVSRRAAIAAIRGNKRRSGLIALGWLTATLRRTAGGEPTSNVYRLTVMPLVAAREKAARTKGHVVSGANGAPPADSQDDSEKASQKAVSGQKASTLVVNVVHYPGEPGAPEPELPNQRRSKEGEGDPLRASSTSSVADASPTRDQPPAQTLAASEGGTEAQVRDCAAFFAAEYERTQGTPYLLRPAKHHPTVRKLLAVWRTACKAHMAFFLSDAFTPKWKGNREPGLEVLYTLANEVTRAFKDHQSGVRTLPDGRRLMRFDNPNVPRSGYGPVHIIHQAKTAKEAVEEGLRHPLPPINTGYDEKIHGPLTAYPPPDSIVASRSPGEAEVPV